MPEVKDQPQPLSAQLHPSDLDACAMLPPEGDGQWYMSHVVRSLSWADGRPAFHSLTFVRGQAEARGHCDFIFQSETTLEDINGFGSTFTARLGLYSARTGRLLTRLALNVSGGDSEVYHAMVRAVEKGTPVYAALVAERGR